MKLRLNYLFLTFIFFSCLLISGNIFSQDIPAVNSFRETEVQIDSGSAAIHGSLVTPDITEKLPVILIIPGSGPTDRNGNNSFGLSSDCYKQLADSLAKKNIASLRYDKRGVSKSQQALESEYLLSVGQYVEDAEKWVKWLRKDPRFSKIIILGHSEGALIGSLVANFQKADGFVAVSGAAVSGDTLIIEQLLKQSTSLADTAKKIINQIKKNEPFSVNKDLEAIFRPSVTGYLKSWFALSPVLELSVVRCPIMIVQGTTDLQVSVENAVKLSKVKPGIRLEIIENMNHLLKSTPSDQVKNLASYRDPTIPLAPSLVPLISEFIFSLK